MFGKVTCRELAFGGRECLVSSGRLFQMWGPKCEKVLEMGTVPDVISLISLKVSVDAKHHVYLLCNKSSRRLIPQCD